MKVVKNKLAPPFRTAHTSLIYGKGIPLGVAVVDMAIDYNVLTKRGGWLAYKGDTIGQGKETVAKFLSENPKLQDEIMKEIMSEVNKGIGFMPDAADMQGDSDDMQTPEDVMDSEANSDLEADSDSESEGVLDISDTDK